MWINVTMFHAAAHLPSLSWFAWHNGELSSSVVRRLARQVSVSRECVLRDAFSGTRAHRPCRVGASVRATPARTALRVGGTYVFGSMQCPAATRQGDGKQCEHTLLTPRPVLAHCATRCASACGVHPHLVRTHPRSSPPLPPLLPFSLLFMPPSILLAAFKVHLMYFSCICA